MAGPGFKKFPSPLRSRSGVAAPSVTASSTDIQAVRWHLRAYDQVAWVLQGGGVLGAYQAGVVAALPQAGIEPT